MALRMNDLSQPSDTAEPPPEPLAGPSHRRRASVISTAIASAVFGSHKHLCVRLLPMLDDDVLQYFEHLPVLPTGGAIADWLHRYAASRVWVCIHILIVFLMLVASSILDNTTFRGVANFLPLTVVPVLLTYADRRVWILVATDFNFLFPFMNYIASSILQRYVDVVYYEMSLVSAVFAGFTRILVVGVCFLGDSFHSLTTTQKRIGYSLLAAYQVYGFYKLGFDEEEAFLFEMEVCVPGMHQCTTVGSLLTSVDGSVVAFCLNFAARALLYKNEMVVLKCPLQIDRQNAKEFKASRRSVKGPELKDANEKE